LIYQLKKDCIVGVELWKSEPLMESNEKDSNFDGWIQERKKKKTVGSEYVILFTTTLYQSKKDVCPETCFPC
jgi:hypothetical protein